MKKKLMALLLCLVMVVTTLAACGGGNDGGNAGGDDSANAGADSAVLTIPSKNIFPNTVISRGIRGSEFQHRNFEGHDSAYNM